MRMQSTDERNASTSSYSATGMMTGLECSEVRSRERRSSSPNAQCERAGAALEAITAGC